MITASDKVATGSTSSFSRFNSRLRHSFWYFSTCKRFDFWSWLPPLYGEVQINQCVGRICNNTSALRSSGKRAITKTSSSLSTMFVNYQKDVSLQFAKTSSVRECHRNKFHWRSTDVTIFCICLSQFLSLFELSECFIRSALFFKHSNMKFLCTMVLREFCCSKRLQPTIEI